MLEVSNDLEIEFLSSANLSFENQILRTALKEKLEEVEFLISYAETLAKVSGLSFETTLRKRLNDFRVRGKS